MPVPPAAGGRGWGPAARARRADRLDRFVAGLLPDRDGIALIAVGGLGRRECAPHGDLDLVLLHAGVSGVDELAAGVWYPIWDARLGLDHSVRTVPEALAVAAEDVKVGLGLLDLRYLAGDRTLAERLRDGAAEQWRRYAPTLLPALAEATRARWTAHGELAFLLEGDLKEARGGLRDVGVLRGIGRAGVADAGPPAVRAAHTRLLDVRDALHLGTGRRVDRLIAQERDAVADRLELAGGDALLRRVATDARTVAYAMDDAWRAVDRWRTGRSRGAARPVRRPIGRDVVEQDGEVVLARTAVGPRPEPSLALRVAAAAATVRLPIARSTLEWLARFCPPPTPPWPAPAREALLVLLGAGAGLVPVWEACERYGLVAGWFPEWVRLSGLPQHNPVHRYTVDRHLVQAAAEAAAFTREVARPDLLVLGAFLHDVGKGLPGDHSAGGAPVAAGMAQDLGLPPADVAVIDRLVRQHLLLPDTATRRDITDPVTVRMVADRVGDVLTLELLHGVTRADAAATGPAAWSPWKGRLIGELVARVRQTLDTGVVPAPPMPDPALVAGDLPAVRIGANTVAVAAADRRGLLASITGCLALHRLDVVTADVSTVDGRALLECAVQSRFGAPPDTGALAADLRRAVRGELNFDRVARAGRRASAAGRPVVGWHRDLATDGVLLELRTADAPGLLYRVARALELSGADVRAARISTLGGAVVDAFYLVGTWSDEAARVPVTEAVLAAAG